MSCCSLLSLMWSHGFIQWKFNLRLISRSGCNHPCFWLSHTFIFLSLWTDGPRGRKAKYLWFDSTESFAYELFILNNYIWSKRWKQIWIDYWCIDMKLMLFHVIVLKFRNEFLGSICNPFYLHNVGKLIILNAMKSETWFIRNWLSIN